MQKVTKSIIINDLILDVVSEKARWNYSVITNDPEKNNNKSQYAQEKQVNKWTRSNDEQEGYRR